PAGALAGIFSLPEGGAPAGAEINLIAVGATGTPGLPFAGRALQRLSSDGAFSFAGVPPGQHTLLAPGTAPFVVAPPRQTTLLARGSRPITNPDGSAAPVLMVWASTQIAVDGEPI